jgi:23S rRNA G2069 N7-methylase RlmK/C1962 C5-methylase RlmI
MSAEISAADFLVANKPSGIATHRPSPDRVGFVEWLAEKHQTPVKVCHRLDKGTSGAMAFARTIEAAQRFTESLTQRQVDKEYLLVSTKLSKYQTWIVAEQKGKGTLVRECPCQEEGDHYLTLTKFQRVTSQGPFTLYKAFPQTGKTHQIRKHATHCGIPLLGDTDYGGETFPRLMLHCRSLQWEDRGELQRVEATNPRLFQDLALCGDLQLAQWIDAIERREILFPEAFTGPESLRLIHKESPDLRVDKVGEKLVLGWWRSEPPTKDEESKIRALMTLFQFPEWISQWRPGAQSRHSTKVLLRSETSGPDTWEFQENGVRFRAKATKGQNFGLFLDQRDRRRWLRDHCANKSVLNLFAFTGGFSVNAAMGGAQRVVTVDLSTPYLEWGQENFRLNQLSPDEPRYEWRRMDALDYLDYASKQGETFDLIVCDPPSFSRNKKSKKVFRIEKEARRLIERCMKCLNPGGALLFSTNFEKWPLSRWQEFLQRLQVETGVRDIQVSPSQWDYEWQAFDANLKAFFLFKA